MGMHKVFFALPIEVVTELERENVLNDWHYADDLTLMSKTMDKNSGISSEKGRKRLTELRV